MRIGRVVVAVVVISLANAGRCWAGDEPSAADEKIARLEALLEAQQQKIERLERRVSDSDEQDADVHRADVMRQQIREILSEREFRESLMPSTLQAGYDDGFVINSSDEKFLLRLNGRLMFRWTHYATRADGRWPTPGVQRDDRTGFDVTRLRLLMSGHAYSKDLTYQLELRGDASDSQSVRVHSAWMNYRFNSRDEFQFKAGQFTLASTRGILTSSFNQQAIERGLVDAVFGLGRGVGVRFWGRALDKRLTYMFDVANATADGEGFASGAIITNDPATFDSNPAILARVVWAALGDNPGNDFTGQSDMEFHETPALEIGASYAYNEPRSDTGTTRIPFKLPRRFGRGGFGLTNLNGLQLNQFSVDGGFKMRGFSLTSEYIVRVLDPTRTTNPPFTNTWLLTQDDSTTAQHGAYVQAGYFLPIPGFERKLEAIARVGGISTLVGGQEGTWEYSGGVNYYIEGRNVKLQADVAKISELPISNGSQSYANVNDDALIFRVQLVLMF